MDLGERHLTLINTASGNRCDAFMMTKTERHWSRAAISHPWRVGRGVRALVIVTTLAALLTQTFSLMCVPQHPEFAASSFGLAAATPYLAAHETDRADACCVGVAAAGGASLMSIAPAFPSGSGWLPVAAALLLFAGVAVPARAALPIVASPPGLRRYHARSSRILR